MEHADRFQALNIEHQEEIEPRKFGEVSDQTNSIVNRMIVALPRDNATRVLLKEIIQTDLSLLGLQYNKNRKTGQELEMWFAGSKQQQEKIMEQLNRYIVALDGLAQSNDFWKELPAEIPLSPSEAVETEQSSMFKAVLEYFQTHPACSDEKVKAREIFTVRLSNGESIQLMAFSESDRQDMIRHYQKELSKMTATPKLEVRKTLAELVQQFKLHRARLQKKIEKQGRTAPAEQKLN